jgi:tRNA 2-selenouridine synthase
MYAGANKKDLIDSFEKIRKRLGGQNVKQALKFIEEGDFGSAAMIALHYYDKSYGYMLEKRACPKFDLVGVESMPPEIAKELIRRKKEFHV